ncbi:hypothetical protein BGZ50_008832 [Haplosporangium sp. Z 11]|nr:hypothetical protein BGZ50_008832 [Haplosporangium sp. Z 11]
MSWAFVYRLLRPLRFTVGLLAFGNFMVLATALRFIPDTDDRIGIDFMDFQQIVLNGFVFIAYLYSFYGRNSWSSLYRLCMIWMIVILSVLYSTSILKKIENQGGCSSNYFRSGVTRCTMQYIITGIELFWTLLMMIEGSITFRQSRDQDWHNRMRIEQEERAMANAVHYQPDLSLYGQQPQQQSNQIRDAESDGFAHGGPPTAVEMEPLPAYVPRAPKDQPHIVDMTNLPAPTYYNPPANLLQGAGSSSHSSASTPSSDAGPSTSTGTPLQTATSPIEPPPAVRLPSYAP